MRITIHSLIAISLCISPAMFAGDDDHHGDGISNVVYIHTNNPTPGKNAVLGYRRNPGGDLTELPGSPFLTGGTGIENSTEVLGPDDTDQELVATPDHRFLYVTNQGSNTITGFAIQGDGALHPVPGSPFPSGGLQPGSIGIDGSILYIVNLGDQNAGASTGTHNPAYKSFVMLPNGSLLPLPWGQPSIAAGSSPTQATIAAGGKLMFDSHLFEVPTPSPLPFVPNYSSVLHSYKTSFFGQLTAAAQTIPPAPLPPYILGLKTHPTQKILYAGLVVASTLATYTYDDAGNMTFAGGTPGGGLGLCWIAISPNGKTIYTSDAVSDQIDVYSIADPLHPVLIQTTPVLNGPKLPQNFIFTGTMWDTTPFQQAPTPDGKFLYVLNHETANPVGNATGNALHIFKVAADGTITELASSPLILPLGEAPVTAHPLGLVAF